MLRLGTESLSRCPLMTKNTVESNANRESKTRQT